MPKVTLLGMGGSTVQKCPRLVQLPLFLRMGASKSLDPGGMGDRICWREGVVMIRLAWSFRSMTAEPNEKCRVDWPCEAAST